MRHFHFWILERYDAHREYVHAIRSCATFRTRSEAERAMNRFRRQNKLSVQDTWAQQCNLSDCPIPTDSKPGDLGF